MRSMSLASPTRRTFHPYARNRASTSSVKADARIPLDGDVVVVVDPAEVVESQVRRQ